jgi:protein-disulfide isomerase-like protein with CxxC motif
MQVTAFVDVLSHWCLAASPALVALRETLAEDSRMAVVFAPIGDGAPAGFTNAQETWFYRRGSFAYGRDLCAAWCEGPDTSTWHANAAVVAAVGFGAEPVALAGAVSRAAMVEGRLLGRREEAVQVVAELTGIAEDGLRAAMGEPGLEQRLHDGNARLSALGCAERPSWELLNDNGDRAVLQGVWQAEAILPLAHAMLADERAYRVAGAPPP